MKERDPNAALRVLIFGTDARPVNVARMAGTLHKSRHTLYAWKENPGKIPVGELRRIARYLGLSWEEVGQAIGGGR